MAEFGGVLKLKEVRMSLVRNWVSSRNTIKLYLGTKPDT